jgi:hypothetical protein
MRNFDKRQRRFPGLPAGLLRRDHFQVAYATNDIDRAVALFRDLHGIQHFRRLEGNLDDGGHIRVELAWVGSIMIELLTAQGPGSEIYAGRLPPGDGFAIRHHHLGYLIYDKPAWRSLEAEAERLGRPLLADRNNPGFLRSCFIDAPEMGHYLEYILPESAGLDFFENVPRN